jgi:hypothetical protein
VRIGKGTPLRLPTKSKAKAQDRYKTVLQRSLTCITKTAIWYTALTGIEKGEFVLLLSESPVKLYRLNGDPVFLSATQNFHLEKDHRFVGEWKVKTDRYEYTLSFSPSLSPELLAWHWHPSTKVEPHLHADLQAPNDRSLHKVHLPTGRVAFERIIECLIKDLGVRPARDNWEGVLSDSQKRFSTFQTWKSS